MLFFLKKCNFVAFMQLPQIKRTASLLNPRRMIHEHEQLNHTNLEDLSSKHLSHLFYLAGKIIIKKWYKFDCFFLEYIN